MVLPLLVEMVGTAVEAGDGAAPRVVGDGDGGEVAGSKRRRRERECGCLLQVCPRQRRDTGMVGVQCVGCKKNVM